VSLLSTVKFSQNLDYARGRQSATLPGGGYYRLFLFYFILKKSTYFVMRKQIVSCYVKNPTHYLTLLRTSLLGRDSLGRAGTRSCPGSPDAGRQRWCSGPRPRLSRGRGSHQCHTSRIRPHTRYTQSTNSGGVVALAPGCAEGGAATSATPPGSALTHATHRVQI